MDIGRNDPCHCGSGKKYKKCCQEKDEAKEHATLTKQWEKATKEFEKAKKDEAENAPPSDKPVVHGHKPVDNPKPMQPKHNTIAAPKFNMPRKAGGGG